MHVHVVDILSLKEYRVASFFFLWITFFTVEKSVSKGQDKHAHVHVHVITITNSPSQMMNDLAITNCCFFHVHVHC